MGLLTSRDDSHDTHDDDHEHLARLHLRLVDTLAGYDQILKSAEPDIRPLMVRFHDLHRTHEAALAARLRAHGGQPDEEGSFFSTVQWAVIKTREVLDEIDEDMLEAVVSGEERILALYETAIATATQVEDLALLDRQRAELAELTQTARERARA